VDVIIGTSILLIALSLAYPGFKVAKDSMSTGGRRDVIERAGDQLLKEVVAHLRSGQITNLDVAPEPPSVTVRHPQAVVDIENLGEESIPWAAEARTIRFRQVAELDEAKRKIDFNRDGDRTDRFALGVLEKIIGGGAPKPITRSARVVLGLPGYAGDVDGDGEGDPLFERDDRSVRVSIHVVTRGEGGRLLRSRSHSIVHLRNVQE
jgi:hypothetical protein